MPDVDDEFNTLPPWCKQLNGTTFAVQVSDYLQNTAQGLGVAIRKIPFWLMRQYGSFAFDGEYREDGKRWWRIKVVKR